MDYSTSKLDQQHFHEEVIIKSEPPEPDDENEVKLDAGRVQVKVEPADLPEGEEFSPKETADDKEVSPKETVDEESTLLNNLNTLAKEDITVKVEPINYDSDDEIPLRPPIPRLAKNAAYKMYHEDEEEIPKKFKPKYKIVDHSKKKHKKTENLDAVLETKSKKFKSIKYKDNIMVNEKKRKLRKDPDEPYECRETKKLLRHKGKKTYVYPEEVTNKLEIITITEEERREEHKIILESRRHMRYLCEPCAAGFVVESAYLLHMKAHAEEAGEFECDLCHLRLKTPKMFSGHKLRHYRRYRCKLCGESYKCRDKASGHVLGVHNKKAFACDKCDSVFKRPQYLKRHQDQYHIKPIKLECPVCQKVFHEKGWYRCHIRTHNEEIRTQTVHLKATCHICQGEFKNKERLKRHLLIHQLNVTCDVCSLVFKNADTLKRHYFRTHKRNYIGPKEENCPHCDRVLSTKAMLTRHIQRMHTPRTRDFECDHCHRLYQTKAEVRSHIMWSHLRDTGAKVAGGHVCECGRVFRTPARLREHIEKGHLNMPRMKKYACEECGKAFETMAVLRRHKEVHSNETYPCLDCGRTFKTRSYVNVHYKLKHLNMTRSEIRQQNQHNRIKEECTQCGRDFETRAQLNLHFWRRHTVRTKDFECDYCKRMYWTKAEVRAHIMWSHLRTSGAAVGGGHVCKCGKVCRTPANLRNHVLKHHENTTNEKKHTCEQCGKAFATKQLLGRHMDRHIEGEPFPCTICDKKFKTQSYLCAHYRRMHTDAYPAVKKISNEIKQKVISESQCDDGMNVKSECIPTDFLVVQIKEEIMDYETESGNPV